MMKAGTAKHLRWLALILLSAVTGCARFEYPQWSDAAGGPPALALLYYPYGPALARSLAAPLPDYLGWPDERIERDLARIAETGVDTVLLAVPDDIAGHDAMRARYEQFFELYRGHDDWPRLVFFITPGLAAERQSASETRTLLINWLVKMARLHAGLFRQAEGRALAVLAPELESWPVHHPALSFRYTAASRNQWQWSPKRQQVFVHENVMSTEGVAVFAGMADGAGNWRLPRRQGRTLRDQLRQAALLRPEYICIASWNNFEDGSFIEPNTLDGYGPLVRLGQEIRKFRGQSHIPDQAP